MIIDNKEYKNFLFVHIPKTGGTSVINTFEKYNLKTWNSFEDYGHDPIVKLKKNNEINENTFIFSVVRNPYTRALSYWHHFNINNNLNYSFMDFLSSIENKKIFNKTPWSIYTQSFFLYENNNLSVTKIYNFENLIQLEKDFNVKLSHERKGNYLHIKNYFNKDVIYKINKIYKEDFINFGYDTILSIEDLDLL
jgi:hypothetical protein